MNERRTGPILFFALPALIAIATGCASTPSTPSMQDPAAEMRIAFHDLIAQMAPLIGPEGRNIGVTPPDGDEELTAYLQDEIISAFLRARITGLAVYERTHINALLQEANLGISGLISDESAMEVGNMVGVDAMVVGTTRAVGDRLTINSRIVDVESGRIISAGSVSIPTSLLGGVPDPMSSSVILDESFEVIHLVLELGLQPPTEMTVHRITTYDGVWTEYNVYDDIMAQGAIRNLTHDQFEIHWTIPEHLGIAVYNYHRTPDSVIARIVVDNHEIGYLEFNELC